jgi:uncharacterized membrane protein (UPF0127 family)
MHETMLTRKDGDVVCDRCLVADSPWRRMRGLLGRDDLSPGEGLLLRPAGSVHTAFMRFAIDVVFLDKSLRVLKVDPEVQPWRAVSCRGAKSVVELPSGECLRRNVAVGDELAFA